MNQEDNYFESSYRSLRIEICGGIASGKTTLATLLKSAEIQAITENFQTNPFWESFYQDPVRYAFETEVSFLLQHYHQIKIASKDKQTFACDFSLLLDLSYANVTLSGSKLRTFVTVHDEVVCALGSPDLLVYLQCNVATELERIRKRGRSVESSITLEYLSKLNDSLERNISTIRGQTKVVLIDSERKNFADDEADKKEVLQLVLQALPKSLTSIQ